MEIAPKKLIEVALPLDDINRASAREKPINHGHPSSLHQWWATLTLAACRAVIFASTVDDPSSFPDEFPTEEAQNAERERLHDIIRQIVIWKNSNDEMLLDAARYEIARSIARSLGEKIPGTREQVLQFLQTKSPPLYDPFCGRGYIPLEAKRLGLRAVASDLNPVAVLINKALIEIPSKFDGMRPANPRFNANVLAYNDSWRGSAGLANDVRHYGQWIRDEAERRIGNFYPMVKITADMARYRPDLERYIGRELTVIAWLWVRTIKSPNPAFAEVDVPLASTFVLSAKKDKEAFVEPVVSDYGYQFVVKRGTPPSSARSGTKLPRANFRCVMSGVAIPNDYVKEEGIAGRMGARMMAVVAEGDNERVFLDPQKGHETVAHEATPSWRPSATLPQRSRDFTPTSYGLTNLNDLFTERQTTALSTISDLVIEARTKMKEEGVDAGYADACSVYLALAVGRLANSCSNLATWQNAGDKVSSVFKFQAIPMIWDFAEVNIFSSSTQNWRAQVEWVARVLDRLPSNVNSATVYQADAATTAFGEGNPIVITDPPYYNNVAYADLSDYFYVWLRKMLSDVYPDLFAGVLTPKDEEMIHEPTRFENSRNRFEGLLSQTFKHLGSKINVNFPFAMFYAFKQQEELKDGVVSTGWETMLNAVISANFQIVATWPMRIAGGRVRAVGSNALSSYVLLVCRPRSDEAVPATRREFTNALRITLPAALAQMQTANIAPVDLAQASIGPGMAVFSSFSKVLDASGESVSVREALALINEILDEVLAEQVGDFDAETRWALAWFEQSGFATGKFGVAETLSKAKNTSVSGMVEAGILESDAGDVRLLRPNELPADWVPEQDRRFTVWEATHHLVRVLDQGEPVAAEMLAKLGTNAEIARELAYRLYRICEQKNRSQEALSYNSLVQSWPEIARIAQSVDRSSVQTTYMDDDGVTR